MKTERQIKDKIQELLSEEKNCIGKGWKLELIREKMNTLLWVLD